MAQSLFPLAHTPHDTVPCYIWPRPCSPGPVLAPPDPVHLLYLPSPPDPLAQSPFSPWPSPPASPWLSPPATPWLSPCSDWLSPLLLHWFCRPSAPAQSAIISWPSPSAPPRPVSSSWPYILANSLVPLLPLAQYPAPDLSPGSWPSTHLALSNSTLLSPSAPGLVPWHLA
jgi:hypothetical protein